MKKHIGFVGLGVMGYPMAGHLVAAGHQVTVYNRSSARAQQWRQEHGGAVANTPALAAIGADIVFSCVGNDDDVRAIALADEGVLAGLAEGSIFVDHTTTSADLAREIGSACAAKRLRFMDAPVSGGQAGAENGALTVMIGGDQQTLNEIEPVIQAYARKVALMGEVGNGQLAKMVNQICIAGLVQGLAEGLNFAEQVGLDAANVIDVISKGAAQSWQMENRYQTMLDKHYEHGFAVDWMRKDLRYAIEEGARNGAELPVTEIVDSYYSDVQSMGGARWDTSSLLARLQARRGAAE